MGLVLYVFGGEGGPLFWLLVVCMKVVPLGKKYPDKGAFSDQICVNQEVSDTWWQALAGCGKT